MGFPAFFIGVILIVALLGVTILIYLQIYKRKINKTLNTGEKHTIMPSPYKVAIVLTITVLIVGIVASFFLGYKIAYDRFESSAEQISPFNIQTYYAEVKEVGENTITVEGISLNEENYRGTFQYDIWGETSIIWKNESITLTDLESGDMVAVTIIMAGGDIADVFKIQLLNDKN